MLSSESKSPQKERAESGAVTCFYSRTGRRREVVYSMRMKQLKTTGAHCTTTYVITRLKIWKKKKENCVPTHSTLPPQTHVNPANSAAYRGRAASELRAEARSMWVLYLFSQMIIRTPLYFMPLAPYSAVIYSCGLT